jgi:hypothetical protein
MEVDDDHENYIPDGLPSRLAVGRDCSCPSSKALTPWQLFHTCVDPGIKGGMFPAG